MESQKNVVGVLRERVADRRGRNIGSVATARRELELVLYALRDGHVRALEHLPAAASTPPSAFPWSARVVQVMTPTSPGVVVLWIDPVVQ